MAAQEYVNISVRPMLKYRTPVKMIKGDKVPEKHIPSPNAWK